MRERGSTRKAPTLFLTSSDTANLHDCSQGFHPIASKIDRFFVSQSIIFAFCSPTDKTEGAIHFHFGVENKYRE